jgi:hypothetical protein
MNRHFETPHGCDRCASGLFAPYLDSCVSWPSLTRRGGSRYRPEVLRPSVGKALENEGGCQDGDACGDCETDRKGVRECRVGGVNAVLAASTSPRPIAEGRPAPTA